MSAHLAPSRHRRYWIAGATLTIATALAAVVSLLCALVLLHG